MHVGVTFSWGISLGFPGARCVIEKKEQNMLQTRNMAACLGRQDIPDVIDVAKWYFSLSSGSELNLKTEFKPSELRGRGRPLDKGEGWGSG